MREVSQTEAIQTLPALLQEAQQHALIIRDNERGENLGALVSMDDLKIIRETRLLRLQALRDEAYSTIKANAEARSEDVDKVLDRLLTRN